MNRILENEIYRLIKRFPTETELNSLVEYIENNITDETFTSDKLPCMVSDWLEENMAQCVNCGKWHLIEDMVNPYGDNEYYCDEECQELYLENAYDMHAEARAEYVACNR